jgi:hypothetical protein
MDTKRIAKTIVLHFHQNNGKSDLDKFYDLSQLLELPFTKEDIQYGIDNVFFNDNKKWLDWKKENNLGTQLYGLRMFVSNSLRALNKFPLPDSYEDEVPIIEETVKPIIKELKKMGIKFNKKWWEFWK